MRLNITTNDNNLSKQVLSFKNESINHGFRSNISFSSVQYGIGYRIDKNGYICSMTKYQFLYGKSQNLLTQSHQNLNLLVLC